MKIRKCNFHLYKGRKIRVVSWDKKDFFIPKEINTKRKIIIGDLYSQYFNRMFLEKEFPYSYDWELVESPTTAFILED